MKARVFPGAETFGHSTLPCQCETSMPRIEVPPEVETVSPAGVRAADPDEPAKPSPEVSAIAGTPTASTRPSATKARATNRVRVVIGGDDGDGFGRPPLEEELR